MGRGRLLQLLSTSLSPCCPYHPAGANRRVGQDSSIRTAFARTQRARPPGFLLYRGHLWVHLRCGPVTRSPSSRWLCQSASDHLVSLLSATQATGLLTLALAGLTPAERASLDWTHWVLNADACEASMKLTLKIVAGSTLLLILLAALAVWKPVSASKIIWPLVEDRMLEEPFRGVATNAQCIRGGPISRTNKSPTLPPTNGVKSRSRPPDGSAKHRGTG